MTTAHSASPVLVTGTAGFIGHAVARQLLDRGEQVVGIDNLNAYYDPALKQARLDTLLSRSGFDFVRGDIATPDLVAGIVERNGIERIVHLAAQAGVRYSIDNPFAYERSNLCGHLAVLEAARHAGRITHLVYASSSSVYGDRPIGTQGFREEDETVTPVSLYAATKRSCELMSHSYASLYGIPQTGLRFFTVYGPWGRPDMAYFSFSEKMLKGETIEIFGEGRMARDFTYIDDIVDGIIGALDHPPAGREPRILNIGDSHPVGLMDMVRTLEDSLGIEASKVFKPMQAGDVTSTFADVSKLHALTGYRPKVRLTEGLRRFADWFLEYRGAEPKVLAHSPIRAIAQP
jgi:UDP-glucuronate 4-epimerase